MIKHPRRIDTLAVQQPTQRKKRPGLPKYRVMYASLRPKRMIYRTTSRQALIMLRLFRRRRTNGIDHTMTSFDVIQTRQAYRNQWLHQPRLHEGLSPYRTFPFM